MPRKIVVGVGAANVDVAKSGKSFLLRLERNR